MFSILIDLYKFKNDFEGIKNTVNSFPINKWNENNYVSLIEANFALGKH